MQKMRLLSNKCQPCLNRCSSLLGHWQSAKNVVTVVRRRGEIVVWDDLAEMPLNNYWHNFVINEICKLSGSRFALILSTNDSGYGPYAEHTCAFRVHSHSRTETGDRKCHFGVR